MKTTIEEILAQHSLWLLDNTTGARANLRGANLSGAKLHGVDLRVYLAAP